MSAVQIESLIERMTLLTKDINENLTSLAGSDFSKMSKSERDNILKEMEHFEVLTSKIEAISKKTEREGVPEIIANTNKNKIEEKLENKPAPKRKINNLMKPTLSNNYQSQNDKKKKD